MHDTLQRELDAALTVAAAITCNADDTALWNDVRLQAKCIPPHTTVQSVIRSQTHFRVLSQSTHACSMMWLFMVGGPALCIRLYAARRLHGVVKPPLPLRTELCHSLAPHRTTQSSRSMVYIEWRLLLLNSPSSAPPSCRHERVSLPHFRCTL